MNRHESFERKHYDATEPTTGAFRRIIGKSTVVLSEAINSGTDRLYNSAPMLRRRETEMRELTDMIEHYKWQAEHDPLTGLLNRRGLDARIDTLITELPEETPLIFAGIDLNDFKQVNDRYGHKNGDRVLEIIGHMLRHAFRKDDLCARMGGDEFTVVIVGNNNASPSHPADVILKNRDSDRRAELLTAMPDELHKLGRTIIEKRVDEIISNGHNLPVPKNEIDFAIGLDVTTLGSLQRGDYTLEKALDAADARMYTVKRSRNNTLSDN